jgi:hypothetical protein
MFIFCKLPRMKTRRIAGWLCAIFVSAMFWPGCSKPEPQTANRPAPDAPAAVASKTSSRPNFHKIFTELRARYRNILFLDTTTMPLSLENSFLKRESLDAITAHGPLLGLEASIHENKEYPPLRSVSKETAAVHYETIKEVKPHIPEILGRPEDDPDLLISHLKQNPVWGWDGEKSNYYTDEFDAHLRSKT